MLEENVRIFKAYFLVLNKLKVKLIELQRFDELQIVLKLLAESRCEYKGGERESVEKQSDFYLFRFEYANANPKGINKPFESSTRSLRFV